MHVSKQYFTNKVCKTYNLNSVIHGFQPTYSSSNRLFWKCDMYIFKIIFQSIQILDKYLYYLCSSMYSKLSNSWRCFHISYNTWFSHGNNCHALKWSAVFTNNYHIIMMKWWNAKCNDLNCNLEEGCIFTKQVCYFCLRTFRTLHNTWSFSNNVLVYQVIRNRKVLIYKLSVRNWRHP